MALYGITPPMGYNRRNNEGEDSIFCVIMQAVIPAR